MKLKLKQSSKLPTWIGGALIQLQMSLVYFSIANITMLSVTMWYTAGYEIAHRYVPWFTIWHFFGGGVAALVTLLILDYTYIAPARMRHINRQATVHKNPAYELLFEAQKDIQQLKKDNEVIKAMLVKLGGSVGE